MALNAAVRTKLWSTTDTAGTPLDVDFGFTPKALLILSATAQTADGVTSTPARMPARVGFAGGTLSANRRCVVYESFDGAATGDPRTRTEDDGVMVHSGSTGMLDVDAEANWPANSIRLIVDTQISSGVNIQMVLLALGGTDIVASTTGSFAEPGATGDQTVTTTGVKPSLVFIASAGTTVDDSSIVGEGAFMLGAADGTRSWVHAMGSDDAADPTDTVSYMKTSQVIALMPTAAAVTIDAEATMVSMASGGAEEFVVNWSSRTAAARRLFYLAVEVATSVVRVDSILTQTNTNNFSATGYGLTPAAAVFVSACRAESTATTPTAHAQISMGMAESSTVREAHASVDSDNVATTDGRAAIETDELYVNIDPTAGTTSVVGMMDLVSFDSGGMTLVMDDADPAQALVGVVTIGAVAAGGRTTKNTRAWDLGMGLGMNMWGEL